MSRLPPGVLMRPKYTFHLTDDERDLLRGVI